MRTFKAIVFFVMAIVLCSVFYACSDESRVLDYATLKDMPPLKVGDIILRQGVGADSKLIQHISSSRFSHIGIIVSINPTTILHATTNDNPSKLNQVLLSDINSFVSLSYAIAIKRFDLSQEQADLIVKYLLSQVGREFVLDTTQDKLYCTTIIESALSKHIKLDLPYTYIDIPLLRGYYLMPQSFYTNTQSKLIYQTP